MNMDDWQNQQKIQKEKERKHKTEAAANLQSHRGGVKEDDANFSAMRAEERKKQQEAEQLRHNYRGQNITEAKVRPVRQDPTHPPPVNANAMHTSPRTEVDTLCAPGSVSAMAANFTSLDAPASEGSGSTHSRELPAAAPEPPVEEPQSAESITEEKKMEAEPVPKNTENEIEEKEVEPEPEPASSAMEAPEEPEIVTTTNTDALLDPQDEPLKGHPTVVRLDVLFSFGLVTSKNEPSLAGYLIATEDIIKETLQQNAELSEHVSYDSMFGPFVQECTVDGKSAHCAHCSSFDRLG
jgi:hypothetical protein